MLVETLLSIHLIHSQPTIPFAATTISSSQSYSSGRSSSSTFRSTSSPVRIRSTYRPPSTIRVSRPSSSTSRASVSPASSTIPKPSPVLAPKAPTVARSSAGNVVINKQRIPAPVPVNKPSSTTVFTKPNVINSSPRSIQSRPTVIRETYVERPSDNIFGNPFFWMYMTEANRQPVQAPVIVNSNPVSESENTKPVITETKNIVKDQNNNAINNIAFFSLIFGISLFILYFIIRA